MRILRKFFHNTLVIWLFSKTQMWVPYAFLAGWARAGWLLGFPAYAAPILLHNLYQRGIYSMADSATQRWSLVAGGAIEILLYWPVALFLIVVVLDLVWLAITAPKQFIFGSLFSSERIEDANQQHLSYLDGYANNSVGTPFD